MVSMTGIGAMAGGWLAQRGQMTGLTSHVDTGIIAAGLGVIGFAATNLFVFALACLLITGFAVIVIGVGEQPCYRYSRSRDARPGDEPLRNDWPRCAGDWRDCHGSLAEVLGFQAPVLGGAILLLVLWWWAGQQQRGMAGTLEGERPT